MAIPIGFQNIREIATPVLQSAANHVNKMIAGGNHTTILCALVRDDRVFFNLLQCNRVRRA